MSIYGSTIVFDTEHTEDCTIWVETTDGVFERLGAECSCKLRNAPIVYEGSHVLPSDDDRRGGSLDVASIPGFIQREGRDTADEDSYHPWLRLSMGNADSTTLWGGKPYVEAGSSAIVLDACQVAELRDYFSEWLDAVASERTRS